MKDKPKPTPRPTKGMKGAGGLWPTSRLSRFDLDFWLTVMACFIKALIIHWLLMNHTTDGNIWGIWYEAPELKIGDFWGTVIMVYLAWNIYASARRTWTWL